jgi:hypothetical protein
MNAKDWLNLFEIQETSSGLLLASAPGQHATAHTYASVNWSELATSAFKVDHESTKRRLAIETTGEEISDDESRLLPETTNV